MFVHVAKRSITFNSLGSPCARKPHSIAMLSGNFPVNRNVFALAQSHGRPQKKAKCFNYYLFYIIYIDNEFRRVRIRIE